MQKKLEPKAVVETNNLSGNQSDPREGDMEVVARATRRSFTNAQRRRIIAKADACTEPGEIRALLRQEGIYSSSLSSWRRKRDAGELSALSPQKRGPKVNLALAEARRFEQLTRENQRLQSQLDKAMLVIEVQKKVSILLGLSLPADPLGAPVARRD